MKVIKNIIMGLGLSLVMCFPAIAQSSYSIGISTRHGYIEYQHRSDNGRYYQYQYQNRQRYTYRYQYNRQYRYDRQNVYNGYRHDKAICIARAPQGYLYEYYC